MAITQGITILAINILILEALTLETRLAILETRSTIPILETRSTIPIQETRSITLRMQGGRQIQGMLGRLAEQETQGTPGHLETSAAWLS